MDMSLVANVVISALDGAGTRQGAVEESALSWNEVFSETVDKVQSTRTESAQANDEDALDLAIDTALDHSPVDPTAVAFVDTHGINPLVAQAHRLDHGQGKALGHVKDEAQADHHQGHGLAIGQLERGAPSTGPVVAAQFNAGPSARQVLPPGLANRGLADMPPALALRFGALVPDDVAGVPDAAKGLLSWLEQARATGDVAGFSIRSGPGQAGESLLRGDLQIALKGDAESTLSGLAASVEGGLLNGDASGGFGTGAQADSGAGFGAGSSDASASADPAAWAAGVGGFVSTLAALEGRDAGATGTVAGLSDFTWVEQIQQQMLEARGLGDDGSLMLDVMLAGDQRLSLQAQIQDGVLKLSVEAGSALAGLLAGEEAEAFKSSLLAGAPDIREVRLDVTADNGAMSQGRFDESGRGREQRRSGDRPVDAEAPLRAGRGAADAAVLAGVNPSQEGRRLSWRA